MSGIITWLSQLSVWLSGFMAWLFAIPAHIKELVLFVFLYLGKFVDYAVDSLIRPAIRWLHEMQVPCLECIETLWSSLDYLLLTDWSALFGFDAYRLLKYFADFFNLGFGFEVILCFSIAKFLLRRLPFIG